MNMNNDPQKHTELPEPLVPGDKTPQPKQTRVPSGHYALRKAIRSLVATRNKKGA